MGQTHRYAVHCSWSGSTGDGYEAYSRNHTAGVPTSTAPATAPATAATAEPATLNLSADPAFHGDPTRMNPEQLLVLAAASCQLLSFLTVAARARLEVVAYEDDAIGEMPEDDAPVRITRIVLRPRITMGAPVSEEQVRRLVQLAHRECYIANSLKTDVEVDPTIVVPAPPEGPS